MHEILVLFWVLMGLAVAIALAMVIKKFQGPRLVPRKHLPGRKAPSFLDCWLGDHQLPGWDEPKK